MLDFRDQPWFHSMETETSGRGRIVVYVKYMDKEVLTGVPDTIDGKQVVVHFSGAKLATREMFTNNPNAPGATLKAYVPVSMGCEVPHEICSECPVDESEPDVANLVAELAKLEKHYDVKTLSDIFFETHDKQNSVTDLSVRYPEARQVMERLYNEYGFDLIYDELEL